MRWLILTLIALLTACAAQQKSHVFVDWNAVPAPPYDHSLYNIEDIHVESIDEIFTLTESQKRDFLSYFNRFNLRDRYPNRRISDYISKKLKQFNFYSDTLTASQSMSNELGNCLSLAIVTHALANIVGVKVEYELVETPSVYQKEGNVILASQHLQSLLYDPGPGELKGRGPVWRSFIRVDYYPAEGNKTLRRVSRDEFYLMYYRNRAAESLAQGRYSVAFAYLDLVLKQDKFDSQAINMMAVLHERAGDLKSAESLYRYGLKYSDPQYIGRRDNGKEQFELLYNYHILLARQQRFEEAEQVRESLSKYQDKNPFPWVKKGDKALEAHQYSEAIRFYRKALKFADYLHEPYLGIAKAQAALGKSNRAKRALKMAIDNAHKADVKSIYQIKYEKLTNLGS